MPSNLTPRINYLEDGTTGPLSFRNKIINGNMLVDQRNAGAAQTFTAAAALAYSVDRWYGYCTGANVTGQRIAGSDNTQYRYRFTGAASVTGIGFAQRIEASNAYSLAGRTATLSVDLSNSLLTTVTWTAFYANTADTFGTLASPTRTQIATGTFTVSSVLNRYSAQISVPAAATTGIEIVLSVGAQISGTWVIGNAQLEAGSQATAFEQRPIGMELGLCQRYFEILQRASLDNDIPVSMVSATNGVMWLSFKTEKRAIPTLWTDSSGNFGRIVRYTSSFVLSQTGATGLTILGTTTSSTSINIASSYVGTDVSVTFDTVGITRNIAVESEL